MGDINMGAWSENYSVGIEKIDNEHKLLFNIINKCYELLFNDIYLDKHDRIIEIIYELEDYTKSHFKEEEEFLLSIGYNKFFSHKVKHDKFLNYIENLDKSKIDDNQDEYIKELLDSVLKWIKNHILMEDFKYKEFLKKKET
ncbi:bacteriohemerythrin [Clostridium baratii]